MKYIKYVEICIFFNVDRFLANDKQMCHLHATEQLMTFHLINISYMAKTKCGDKSCNSQHEVKCAPCPGVNPAVIKKALSVHVYIVS